jgi:hypothetical protein
VTTLEDLKAVVLRKLGELHIPVGFLQGYSEFFVVDVRDALEEQQWEM